MEKREKLDNIEAIAQDWIRGRITIQEARKNWALQIE